MSEPMYESGKVIKGICTGTYLGKTKAIHGPLKGEHAELILFDDGTLKAQFDNVSTGFGHGWTRFQQSDWKIDESIDWDSCD